MNVHIEKSCSTRIVYNGLDSRGRQCFKVFLVDTNKPRPRPTVEADLVIAKNLDETGVLMENLVFKNIPEEEKIFWATLAQHAFLKFNPVANAWVCFSQSVIEQVPTLAEGFRLKGPVTERYYSMPAVGWKMVADHLESFSVVQWGSDCNVTSLRAA